MKVIERENISELVGHQTEASDWLEITQSQVNQFADCTFDHQFIHIDEERAKSTPFGGTIAHGFLSLSLLSHFLGQIGIVINGAHTFINYGLDSVRFLAPVRVGKRVRAQAVIESIDEKNPGQFVVRYNISVEIEDEDKPALVATFITMQILS